MQRIALLSTSALIAGSALLTWWRPGLVWLLLPTGILTALAIIDYTQRPHAIRRNFPLLGRLRYFFEWISPEIQQYFIERRTDGVPISRNHRAIVYQRSKDLPATHPFGTQLDLYDAGYEGLRHSLYPVAPLDEEPLVRIGGEHCTQPYEASMLNVSAMSFGSISGNAIRALSRGAAVGGFYLNTGEGSVSEHHLSGGCDLVWQIGTGYFGCRDEDGTFDADAFAELAGDPAIKMIELKLSQGAKPGHGGVLPASKNNEEIARVRGIEPHVDVHSPPAHTAFEGPDGMLDFVAHLRQLAGGKPVGIKLCVGRLDELRELCERMAETGLAPDFITVDGAEGGTGAAPLEFSDSVGMPSRPALQHLVQLLEELGLRERVVVVSSGKILTAASVVRALAMGADGCNAARAYMLAVGCIQALRCDKNTCPTGVATQDPKLTRGLVVDEKSVRVERFHRNTVRAVLELSAACGERNPHELTTDVFLDGSEWAHLATPTPG